MASCRWEYDGVDEVLDHVPELFSDPAADRLRILKVARDEAPQIDGIADAQENVPIGQLVWPLGTVALTFQLENHLREPLPETGPGRRSAECGCQLPIWAIRESCSATSASAGSVADADNGAFSHTGVVAIENGEPVVYDTTKMGVACQPFGVWILDNVGALGVKRLRPEHRGAVPKVLAYCHKVFQKQVPFDYELGPDDSKLYCVEMTEKAFRAAGVALSEPIALGDMEPHD